MGRLVVFRRRARQGGLQLGGVPGAGGPLLLQPGPLPGQLLQPRHAAGAAGGFPLEPLVLLAQLGQVGRLPGQLLNALLVIVPVELHFLQLPGDHLQHRLIPPAERAAAGRAIPVGSRVLQSSLLGTQLLMLLQQVPALGLRVLPVSHPRGVPVIDRLRQARRLALELPQPRALGAQPVSIGERRQPLLQRREGAADLHQLPLDRAASGECQGLAVQPVPELRQLRPAGQRRLQLVEPGFGA